VGLSFHLKGLLFGGVSLESSRVKWSEVVPIHQASITKLAATLYASVWTKNTDL
jgi:hypothetical protein